ncbi:MAG: KH domain-containing protein [Candidatus Woesearchaeota archaeon]
MKKEKPKKTEKIETTGEIKEFSYELKIPKERVAVLIGTKGETKKQIETATKTRLQIDSKEGDVEISGEDALNLYSAREIVRAIGRGFNPANAMLLLKGDYGFDIISIKDYAKTKNDEERLKGRVIGEEGKARRIIEELSECHISVYGKTISIIGQFENLTIARRAIELLLAGSSHAHVYRLLEKARKELKMRSIESA